MVLAFCVFFPLCLRAVRSPISAFLFSAFLRFHWCHSMTLRKNNVLAKRSHLKPLHEKEKCKCETEKHFRRGFGFAARKKSHRVAPAAMRSPCPSRRVTGGQEAAGSYQASSTPVNSFGVLTAIKESRTWRERG